MTDDERLRAMGDKDLMVGVTGEVVVRAGPMELVLRPQSVFIMAAMLQLAARHPAVTATMRVVSDNFLAGAREYFADCPHVLEVLRRGADPSYDENTHGDAEGRR